MPSGTSISPRRGGTRLHCPVVDVNATASAGKTVMCAWPSRAQTAKGAKAWRRHLKRAHLEAFARDTSALLRYVQRSSWLGMKGLVAEVSITRAGYREDDDD
jgi:hypothetical protein